MNESPAVHKSLTTSWQDAPTRTVSAGGVSSPTASSARGPECRWSFSPTWPQSWTTGTRGSSTASPRSTGSSRSTTGVSARPRARLPTTIEAMADDAVTFIRALGLDQVDLLGFSMGGMIAQVIARENPQLVRKLILAGTGPAGGEGIENVTALHLDTVRGCSPGRTRSSSCSSPGPRTGAAPARSSWPG